MSVRKLYYLACTNCGDQFHDPDDGPYGESPRELRERARDRGWCRRRVQNGSVWDFCPRCIADLRGH